MDNKLTLSMDNQVIEQAKRYARKKNISLSKLIEGYLLFLTTNDTSEVEEVTPLVKSLSGVLSSKTSDPKAAYHKHLTKKYSK